MNFFSKSGYTIIELVVVMVILAILAAAAFMRYQDNEVVLQNAVERMASDLRYMRSMAVNSSMPHGIRFTKPDPNGVEFIAYTPYFRDESGTVKAYEADPSHIKPISLEDDLRGVSGIVETAAPGGAIVNIVFSFDGAPYLDFALEDSLNDYLRIEFSRGGKSRQVTVFPRSGEVKIE